MHVLIVDDEESVRVGLARLLSLDGHTSEGVATGEEALSILRQYGRTIDVVLLDLHLGGRLSGYDVAHEKLMDERLHPIPFIVITGSTVNKLIQSNPLEGATIIMEKPINGEALARAMNAIAAKKAVSERVTSPEVENPESDPEPETR